MLEVTQLLSDSAVSLPDYDSCAFKGKARLFSCLPILSKAQFCLPKAWIQFLEDKGKVV